MTPSNFSCPHCNGQLANVASYAGQVVSCPHCGKQFRMPGVTPPPMPPLFPANQTASPFAARFTMPEGIKWPLLIGATTNLVSGLLSIAWCCWVFHSVPAIGLSVCAYVLYFKSEVMERDRFFSAVKLLSIVQIAIAGFYLGIFLLVQAYILRASILARGEPRPIVQNDPFSELNLIVESIQFLEIALQAVAMTCGIMLLVRARRNRN